MSEQVDFFEKKAVDIDSDTFKEQVQDYTKLFEAYKSLDLKMKQYEANIKAHMLKEGIESVHCNKVNIVIHHSEVYSLDRSIIPNIHEYYRHSTRIVLRRSKGPKGSGVSLEF